MADAALPLAMKFMLHSRECGTRNAELMLCIAWFINHMRHRVDAIVEFGVIDVDFMRIDANDWA